VDIQVSTDYDDYDYDDDDDDDDDDESTDYSPAIHRRSIIEALRVRLYPHLME
jgi:hypothetical protein